ncbi:hypothetical protein AX15_005745 [Amanita polypyramis BW_CC]|nr:hypothetical protein AX15_005745 [Amanita polypyramis BW_CC]
MTLLRPSYCIRVAHILTVPFVQLHLFLANAFETATLRIMYHYSRPTSRPDSRSSTYGLSSQYPDEAGPPNTNTVVSPYPQPCGCAGTREVSTFPATKYVAVSVTNVYIGVIKIKNDLERVPMVARVSITDYRGNVILDTFVRPTFVSKSFTNHHIDTTGSQT